MDDLLKILGAIPLGIVITLALFTVGAIWQYSRIRTEINDWIDKRVFSPEFIDKVAAQAQPMAILDATGSVIWDKGAMNVITNFEFTPGDRDPLPTKLLLHCNRHLAQPPIVTYLGPDKGHWQPVRGQQHDWEYSFDWIMRYEDSPGPWQFLIQII